jgi:sugar phosphate isomerase/epimerase
VADRLGRDDLILCSGTVPLAPFRDYVAAASSAGFQGISMWGRDYRRAHAEGLTDADLRPFLDDHGLAVGELDGVGQWFPGSAGLAPPVEGEEADSFFGFSEQDLYAIADVVGARSVNAVEVYGMRCEPEQAAEAFGALCDRAAEHGLLVHIEYLPWSGIPNAAAAWEVVRLADRPNGGVLVDSWHHFRGASTDAMLRDIPGARVTGIQLNDAPAEAEADPVEECLRRRLVPGEGAIDLAGLLRALDEQGVAAPIGVEVMSDALNALPVKEVAQRVADATRAMLDQARGAHQ